MFRWICDLKIEKLDCLLKTETFSSLTIRVVGGILLISSYHTIKENDMNKFNILVATIFIFVNFSFANCIGTGAIQTCYDNNGNNYTVTRIGNTTTVDGSSNNGSHWSQTSQTVGNTTITNGVAADGNTWNSTTNTFQNGTTITNGTDSKGNSFSKTCFSNGICY